MSNTNDWLNLNGNVQREPSKKDIAKMAWLLAGGAILSNCGCTLRGEINAERDGITVWMRRPARRPHLLHLPLTRDGNDRLLAHWEGFKANAEGRS